MSQHQPSGFYSMLSSGPSYQQPYGVGGSAPRPLAPGMWQQQQQQQPPPPPPALYNYSNSSHPQYYYRQQPQQQQPAPHQPRQYHRHHPRHQQQWTDSRQQPHQPRRPPPPAAVETSRKRPRYEEPRNDAAFKCDPCQVSFDSPAALAAHTARHETCSVCTFQGSPTVVKGHFAARHGKYAQAGFKTVTIQVPGGPVQRFRICVGNRPEDVAAWIAQRKQRFPRQQQKQQQPGQGMSTEKKKESSGLNALLDGYGSSSSEEDEKDVKNDSEPRRQEQQPPEPKAAASTTANKRPCRFFLRNGNCRNGDQCSFSHDVSSRKQRERQPSRTARNKQPPSLYSRLLADEVGRESALTLQLLQFIVDSNFFQNDHEQANAEAETTSTSSTKEGEGGDL